MNFPKSIYSGAWNGGHCQGIALDRKNGWMYYSFTTILVKTDLQGNVLGSVGGLTGHMGCIAFCEKNGLVYGSLEYKNDAIGRGILRHLGQEQQNADAFYMTMFDGAKIDRVGMDATRDGVMLAAYLKDVVDDYSAKLVLPDGTELQHRYGCSGIDGTAIGPMFGEVDGEPVLTVAYGVYGDVERTDNDYQVLLCYDLEELRRTARPLSQENMHTSGPEKPLRRLFAYTGNTVYGIQNLEYDPYSRSYLAAVYLGKKPQYPNWPMYAFDATVAPAEAVLSGVYPPTRGGCVRVIGGEEHAASGVRGWTFEHGQTGLIALGEGLYYVSYEGREGENWNTTVRLCEWDGVRPMHVVE